MDSKEQKIQEFDQNGLGQSHKNIFGLPFTQEEAEVVIVPVPWDATASYGKGTALGPNAVLDASLQVDLHDLEFGDIWKSGIYMNEISSEWLAANSIIREKSKEAIELLENGHSSDDETIAPLVNEVDKKCAELNEWVYMTTLGLLRQNKKVGLLGGEHSCPLGYYQAMATIGDFTILQIDAHADLRASYEGFEFSHASIMHNALKLPQVKTLVQVGVRDICEAEMQAIKDSGGRIQPFFDRDIKRLRFEGETWEDRCMEIIAALTNNVHISFDIDGLDPKLCPNTGTPVPGGLRFEEISYFFSLIKESGKQITGFDLCEVGNDPWDANVGARILYKLCGLVA